MAEISQNVNIEMLEKLPDGSYKKKHPETKASQVKLEDAEGKFTATELEGAMSELFTNVSDGKDLVGGAITDVDDSVVIPTDPTFSDLASAIGSISTGKKWASGNNRSSYWTLNVTGLGFKPSFVVAQYDENAPSLNVIVGGASPTTKQLFNMHITTSPSTLQSSGSFTINNNGFIFDGMGSCGFSANHDWIAFE
ncbi:MAG TPA: hypothetical protein VFC73_00300 [Syntrophomonadaceae bacterium]|nr:hypothetical protein [Syntrophomonadaceae bacterium]